MIPSNALSPEPVQSRFIEKMNSRIVRLVDYQMGGVGLNDASQGLLVRQWTLRYEGGGLIISADGVADTVLFSRPGITEVALAFDQLMNPFVAFTDAAGSTFWWFDTAQGGMVFAPYLPSGSKNVRCTMDDKRAIGTNLSDIIISYMRGDSLYFRQQRERFEVEHLLESGLDATLISIGMNAGNRLQWMLMPNG